MQYSIIIIDYAILFWNENQKMQIMAHYKVSFMKIGSSIQNNEPL